MEEVPPAIDEKTHPARRILFWLVPAVVGGGLLVAGICVVRGSSDLEVLRRLAGAILLILGAGILAVLAALVLILWLIRRLFRGLKSNAKSLAYSVKYMLRQGRMRD